MLFLVPSVKMLKPLATAQRLNQSFPPLPRSGCQATTRAWKVGRLPCVIDCSGSPASDIPDVYGLCHLSPFFLIIGPQANACGPPTKQNYICAFVPWTIQRPAPAFSMLRISIMSARSGAKGRLNKALTSFSDAPQIALFQSIL